MGDEEKKEATEQPEGEVTEATTQPKMYSQEELDTHLILADEKAKDGYKAIQRTVADREREIRELQSQPVQSKTSQILLEEMKLRQTESGERNPRIAELETELTTERRREANTKQQAYQQSFIVQKRGEIEQKIKAAGLNPDDEMFNSVNDAFEVASYTGQFEATEARLDKVLSKQKPPEKKEDKAKYEADVEEGVRKKLAEDEQLVTETGSPSGSGKRSYTAEEIGVMSYDEWVTLGKPETKV